MPNRQNDDQRQRHINLIVMLMNNYFHSPKNYNVPFMSVNNTKYYNMKSNTCYDFTIYQNG